MVELFCAELRHSLGGQGFQAGGSSWGCETTTSDGGMQNKIEVNSGMVDHLVYDNSELISTKVYSQICHK